MKAIILAAGKGSRISDDIGPIPKSTLKLNGVPIIRTTVEKLLDRGIEVAVCTGYRFPLIQEALQGLPVTYYHNPFYGLMNNIGTLWFARDFMDDECIIISADVVFDDELLSRIINSKGDLLMVTDKSRINDGDYFFTVDTEGRIVRFGPDIEITDRSCEYVGLAKISNYCIEAYKNKLDDMILSENNQCYFEYVFFSFLNSSQYTLKTIDVSGCSWREIDRIEDYRKALEEFK